MIINRSDCIANFQFEDNVTNSVVGGTNGTVTGTATYIDSISGKAFDFNGSTRIEIGNSGLSNGSDLTVLLRLNSDPYATGNRFFSKSTAPIGDGFEFRVLAPASDTLEFRVRNAANTAWVSVTQVIPDSAIYAIRAEINLSTEITISTYAVDGTYTTNSTAFLDATYTSNTDNITIGALTGSATGMTGSLDDFTVITSILDDYQFYRYYMGLGIQDL